MKLFLLAALAIIVAGVIVWNIGSKIVGEVVSNTQQNACTDTNPENNEKLQGSVSYKTWYGTTKTAYDSCDPDDNAALKYSCNGKKITTERIPCKEKCNAAGTACQGEQWNLALLPLDTAFSAAEPGDDFFFDGITLPVDTSEAPTSKAKQLQLKVLSTSSAAPNTTLSSRNNCIQFSLSSIGARKFAENILSEASAPSDSTSEPDDETGADKNSCYYVSSSVLETPNAKEFHTTIETYVDGLARIYERYCTKKISGVPVKISACQLPPQQGSEDAQETSAALKLTIRFGKK
jgi:hypothetical protein